METIQLEIQRTVVVVPPTMRVLDLSQNREFNRNFVIGSVEQVEEYSAHGEGLLRCTSRQLAPEISRTSKCDLASRSFL